MNLEVKNITKILNEKVILKDISFNLNNKEIVGFIGNNGAGKTTTIKAIFQEYLIDSGEICIDGNPITQSDLKKIEFFPDQNNFPKNYSIKEYCWYNFILSNPKAKKEEFKITFSKIMDALDLKENLNSKFSQISSGMQKKALLAMVLINKPKIIILDEPTANLDVQTRLEFIELLKSLVDKMEISILITSHDINELQTFVNKIIFIKEGSIILDQKYNSKKDNLNKIYEKHFGTEKKVINSAKIKEVFNDVF